MNYRKKEKGKHENIKLKRGVPETHEKKLYY
jgi:hypothetical protein